MPSPRRSSAPHRQSSPRSSSRGKKAGGSSKTPLYIALAVAGIAAIGGLVWWLLTPPSAPGFTPNALRDYVEAQPLPALLSDNSEAVYLDFSDGMNHAFATPEAQAVLRDITNKLNGPNVEFFSLANNKISELETGSVTQLYNTIMNPKSYLNHSAPIQMALEQIAAGNRPALLITDFEEYNNGQIQQAAYAKESFINWIARGNNITFYSWDFTEKNKDKKLFIAVFDDQTNRLAYEIDQAIRQSNPAFIDRFILCGKDFQYPMKTIYTPETSGGGFHNADGVDIISGIDERGEPESFTNYASPIAASDGKGFYDQKNKRYGRFAQYYPVTFPWKNVVKNARGYHPYKEGDPAEFHFLSKLFINFNSQQSFEIDDVEARVFNVEYAINDSTGTAPTPELFGIFEADTEEIALNDQEKWQELIVDFDDNFDGIKFPAGTNPTDLMRINLIIADANPRIEAAKRFFSWPGNNSLSASVVNTLQSDAVNPKGTILMSYYVKCLSNN